MEVVSIIGVDLAKNVFELHGVATDGVVSPLEDTASTTGSIKINGLRGRDGVDAALP